MDSQPAKADIESVFQRLRAIPANKTCFDCNAKNPTWSSVTYGVFICIDCSAVHRSLGVHLTFVRSTQLDTNWTWLQLRQMQLGGNSNALQFFSQHNCNTNDAQKKYNSRAAQLYREKLSQAAQNSIRTNNESIIMPYSGFFLRENQKLHIHPLTEEKPEEKEVDFFTEHAHFEQPDLPQAQQLSIKEESKLSEKATSQENKNAEGPKVDFSVNAAPVEARKSTIISNRKAPAKKSGLGAKKSGLGATKVKTNFADLEREAELAETSRLRSMEESVKVAQLTAKEQEDREAAVRLAYKDISNEQHKREEQVRKQDPKKADQVERLGMGINSRSGISHSALSDMQVIEQENVQPTSSTLSSLGKLRISDTDYFEDYIAGTGVYSPSFSMNRTSKLDSFLSESTSSSNKDSWVIIDDPPEKPKSSYTSSYGDKARERQSRTVDTTPSTDEAQKKFGNAKAISSDQYFNDGAMDYETKANLNRFQGSSSISSAEFFGNGKEAAPSGSNIPQYDLEDVKESVRQGVTKVAGKIGSLANGLMTSIQDRYGY